MERLSEIQRRLESLPTPDALAAYQRLIPTKLRIYGVRTPKLNELAKEFAPGGFELVDALWESGAYEERLIAVKILGRLARRAPGETWQHVQDFVPELGDWAICDTLAAEGIRGLLPKMGGTVFESAIAHCRSEGEWERRFGLVLLTHFVKDESRVPALRDALAAASSDKRHYVRKAVEWLRRDLDR